MGLSGVGPVRVGRTALWKHGRKTSWCVRLSRGGGGGGGGGVSSKARKLKIERNEGGGAVGGKDRGGGAILLQLARALRPVE